MSETFTAIMTFVVVVVFAAMIGEETDNKRVKHLRFEHKGQIYMLVPAKLHPTKEP